MTDKSLHDQIKEIFSKALELDISQRSKYLDDACLDNSELRAEIESLLNSFAKSENFIEQPAANINDAISAKSQVNKQFGNYKIIKEIGKGGMGVVYLATREDEEFRKRVAIKVVKRGLDTEDVLRRFRNERQILASLHHPNIAQLLDGGTTNDGLPYFVMEYVDGLPLIKYCEEMKLSTKERLDLFKVICSAVHHAHQNLVIHRDLKPSNILVTHNGEVKLLDFGVAKFLNPELMGDSSQTQTQFRVMTPEYASPEQIKGSHITTATDIYSLGVILYELLTGKRPYQLKDKSFEEVFQTITKIEPILPSRVASSGGSTKVQQFAIGNPQLLKGDLDNIVLMALRKEPARRYESVEHFSGDIQRHLRGLPVIARPNTFSYRAEKFVKRNIVASAVGVLLILSLIGGLIISLRQTSIAYAQEKKAVTEAEKSQKITKFMEKVLNYANPSWYAEGSKLNGQAKLIEVLDDLSDKIETEFPGDLDIQAELHHKSAEIYNAKGNRAKALFHAEAALKIRRSIYGDKNAEVAKDMYYLASVCQTLYKYNKMKKLYDESAAIFREVDPDNPNFPYLLEDSGSYLSDIIKDYDQSERTLTEALEMFRKKDGEIHFNTARLYLALAEVFALKGEKAKADEYFREGENRFNQLPDKSLIKFFIIQQAKFEYAKSNWSVAENLLETLIAENTGNNDLQWENKGYLYLRQIYWQDGNYPKLTDFLKKELESAKQALPRDETRIGLTNLEIARVLYRLGKTEEAKKYFDEGFVFYKTLPADSTSRLSFNQNVGEFLFHQKRYAEANPILQNVAVFHAENFPPNYGDVQTFKDMLDKTEAVLKD